MKTKPASQSAFLNPRVLIGILCLFGLFLALFAFHAFPGASALAQAPDENSGIEFGESYHNDVSPALRDLPVLWPPPERKDGEAWEANLNPQLPLPLHADAPDPVVDRGVLEALVPNIPSPSLNFDGITVFGGCAGGFCFNPPDTNGAIGVTQYVQIVNEGYQVFNKATGASVLGPTAITAIWSGFGGVCQNNGDGDPVVLYDHIANRWLISQFAGTSIPTDECIAISTTSDATGTYNRYAFHLGSNFFDYPHLGIWPDGYYMSMNVLNTAGDTFLGPQAFAFDRAKMLAGLPATFVTPGRTGGGSEPTFLPSDLDGSLTPPVGTGNSFVSFPGSGVYKVRRFHADFVTPSNTTFTQIGSPAAAGFTLLCPGTSRNACVPQLGTINTVEGLADRLMFRLPYRKFADGHEAVVGNYTVSAGGVASVRWFELRAVTTAPVVFQESTYHPDPTWRWMGSAAMDQNGDLAIGYSASSASIYPEIRYAGRLATDLQNTLGQGEATLFSGTGSQGGAYNRWGDYSALTVDPVDDCTFWYTQEYYATTTSSFNWRTRIGSFKFTACPPGPTQCVQPPAQMVGWWPGDGNANDIISGNNGSLQGGATFGDGRVAQGFSLDGTSAFINIPSTNTTMTALTIDAWINADQVNGGRTIVSKYDSSIAQVSYSFAVLDGKVRFGVYENFSDEGRVADTVSVVVAPGIFTHVAGTFDAATQEIKIYVNGSEVATTPVGSSTVSSIFESSVPIRIGAAKNLSGNLGSFFAGIIDEVEIFDRALAVNEIQSIYTAGSAGKCKSGSSPTPTPTATLTPTPINISGTISYCSNPVPGPVPNVTLTLTGTMSASTLSDGSGNYTFSSLPSGGNYTVTPTKAARTPGSANINTVDVIAVQKQYLTGTFLSGCRLTAADVNGDSVVNTQDVIAVQRFYTGQTTAIANVGKYKFTPVNRTYTGIVSNQTAQNYDTLVFGDVASGFVELVDGPSQTAPDDGASADEVPATVAAVALPEVTVDIPVTNVIAQVTTTAIDAKNKLVGFQGDFTFDERVVTFAGEAVQKAGVTGGNWNVSGNVLDGPGPIRTLRISAYSLDFTPLSGSGTLFELRMTRVGKAAQSTQLIWAAPPDQFIFIDADLKTQKPGNAAPGSVTHSGKRK